MEEALTSEGEDPFWRRLGFSSFDDYLEDIEDVWRRVMPQWAEPRARDLPDPDLPGAGARTPARRPRGRTRQVGMKLRPDDYDKLARAAELYGVRPSTLARMLVANGARAALQAYGERS